ncbi:hypothetical protein E1A91_A08G049000v1 [Gossypium mustelinum]|uniref:GTP-binding protein SAR1A n=1 Tax=Gossypium mustelinum TaxID=34275 RepID=A0A5D2Y4M9_GOSMU|nr:hypothetical protein E1A91_A08G049000v1 [Gossypium mustelinum]
MFLVDWFYGILASLGLWQKEAKILFLGLDNAGKTTLLHMLKDERLVQHQPTQSPHRKNLVLGKLSSKLSTWEVIRLLAGSGKITMLSCIALQLCSLLLVNFHEDFSKVDNTKSIEIDPSVRHGMVDAVVYLVDAYDKERFAESKKELDALLSDESLANVPFLILGNKIDIPYAASEDELRYHLGLTNFTTGKGKVNLADSNVRPLEVFMCSIVRKMGYGDGFKWMSQYIN